MEFDDFLIGKKIDPEKFKFSENDRYREWKHLFDQVHPDSFTQQKLFLINKVRRAYTLKKASAEKKTTTSRTMRPKPKPLKPKTN